MEVMFVPTQEQIRQVSLVMVKDAVRTTMVPLTRL